MTRLRGLVALVVLAVLIGALPWALLQFGDWPIHGLPSGEQLRDLSDSLVSDTAVFAVLTVAAWLVWAVFMVSVVVESSAAVRGIQAPKLVLAGPLQRCARGLVAALVLAVLIQHGSRSPAAGAASGTWIAQPLPVALDAVAATTELIATAQDPPTITVASKTQPSDQVVTVRAGDSAWSIAETRLGDGMRWRHLWETNRGVTQPDGRAWTDPQIIRVGWQLRIPTARAATTAEPTGVVHTVVRGDTLSGIADADLGDPARYTAIFQANRDVEQPDGRRLDDPDLILPGWDLRLPGAATPAPPAPRPPPASSEGVDPGPTPSTEVPTPGTTATSVSATSRPAPTSTTTSPPVTQAIDSSGRIDGEAGPPEGDWISSAPTLTGIAGAVALATGLALHIRFLRRRLATRGATVRSAISVGKGRTEDAVVAAADVPLVRWAGQHLAQLVQHLDRRAVTGAPVAVELSDTTGLELLWDTAQPDAFQGWTVADGGWAWRLAYDPDAPVPVDELPAAIPALVTVGHRDGRQLMIDLEACGALTVSGNDDRVQAFLRSAALELATDQDLADAYVHVVGFDPGVGHLDRLGTSDVDEALRHLEGARRSVTEALDVARLDGTFAARAGSATPIEATVVIAHPGSGDDARRLLQAAPAHRGIAVIVAGDKGMAAAHIELVDDGSARIEPLGIAFTSVAMPADSAAALDGLLDALDAPPPAPGDGHRHPDDDPRLNGDVVGKSSTNGHRPHNGNGDGTAPHGGSHARPTTGEPIGAELFPAGADHEGITPALFVRVLGTPGIPDRPDLGRRELILTVLLACRRRPVAASTAQDALWGGKPVEAKTVWNVVGATRRALGDLPDGTPVMPSADRTRGTLSVAPGVVTDLTVLHGLVEQAGQTPSSEAIGLLRQGLGLVAGPPFDAAGFDWAHRDQDVAEACTLIEHATQQLVELALDAGLVDVARDAIVRGLRGLPGNEELYRCRMRVEHRCGNLPGVSGAYDELVIYLADLETEPSTSTTALYRDLVRPVRR